MRKAGAGHGKEHLSKKKQGGKAPRSINTILFNSFFINCEGTVKFLE